MPRKGIYLLLTAVFLFANPAGAERTVYEMNAAVVSPMEAYINNIMNTYSDAQLRNFAKKLNDYDIQYAKKNGLPMPIVLSEKSLNNRESIRKYLRSYFGYDL